MIIGYHKRRWSILTAGRWSWKSKSVNECVITHLPNRVALKMDSAETCNQCQSIVAKMQAHCVEGHGCKLWSNASWCYQTVDGADLGGSSKYSNITLEGRSGMGSMWIVIWHGLADLKVQCSSAHASFASICERGCREKYAVIVYTFNSNMEWLCNVKQCFWESYLFLLTIVHNGTNWSLVLFTNCNSMSSSDIPGAHLLTNNKQNTWWFTTGRTDNRIRSLGLVASSWWINVGEGSRHDRSATSG